jgi:aspartyl/asparaginyl-tRNA synthetase
MDIFEYSNAITQMRDFFQRKKGFIEVPSQSRRSILAACEDPKTISQYIFSGINWPLPQTGQMWLERELLEHPELPGVFCISTSYRNEPDPIPGRHDKIFPMFEFESKGTMSDMVRLEAELLEHMGFDQKAKHIGYDAACVEVSPRSVIQLEAEHEEVLQKKYGDVIYLKNFPLRSDPFWNMKQQEDGKHFSKVDVLLYGMETIGSAERSCDVEQMRNLFYSISDGQYAKLLFNHFGQLRVERELEEYFSLDMFERFGGGIGLTRMCRALRLLDERNN